MVLYGWSRTSRGHVVRAGKRAIVHVDERVKDTPPARFTIAHELGHHRLHDVGDLFIQCEGGGARERSVWRVEREANDFAAELLIPEAFAAPRLRVDRPMLDDVERLARVFDTSLEAAAIRVVQLTRAPCAAALVAGGVIRWALETEAFPIVRRRRAHAGSVAAGGWLHGERLGRRGRWRRSLGRDGRVLRGGGPGERGWSLGVGGAAGVGTACDRILLTEIFRWMRRDLELPSARGGAVPFVQRFGGSLNLHVHYHVMVLDGVFERIGPGAPAFVPARAPTPIELSRVVERVARSVRRWISKHRVTPAAEDPDALAGCTKLAVQRGLFTELDARVDEEDDHVDAPHGAGKKSASHDGFDLHAAVRVGADDDVARERLARYCARPAFALERLSVLPDGRIAYALKNPRRGASHRALTPVELLARIAALIPPPRHPFIRFHGVLAPASKWRALVVPRVAPPSIGPTPCRHSKTTSSNARAAWAAAKTPGAESDSSKRATTAHSIRDRDPAPSRESSPSPPTLAPAHLARLDDGRLVATSPRLDWATLLRRTFAEDVLAWPKCHARTRIVAAITAPAAIRHPRTPRRPPRASPTEQRARADVPGRRRLDRRAQLTKPRTGLHHAADEHACARGTRLRVFRESTRGWRTSAWVTKRRRRGM